MEQVSLDVPDISCGHCKLSIEQAVRILEGVVNAKVQLKQRRVDVDFDERSVDRATIVSAIEGQGYTVPAG